MGMSILTFTGEKALLLGRLNKLSYEKYTLRWHNTMFTQMFVYMHIFIHNLLPKSSNINVHNMFAVWHGIIISCLDANCSEKMFNCILSGSYAYFISFTVWGKFTVSTIQS